MIINNTLKEGDTLPSMRLLAKELRISVITTNVPMKSLSVTALLKQSQGKEVLLLKKNTQLILESQLQIIEEYIQKAINVAKNTEIDIDKLHKMLDLLYSEQ
jgi:GntR family transcriptional regulator